MVPHIPVSGLAVIKYVLWVGGGGGEVDGIIWKKSQKYGTPKMAPQQKCKEMFCTPLPSRKDTKE